MIYCSSVCVCVDVYVYLALIIHADSKSKQCFRALYICTVRVCVGRDSAALHVCSDEG